MVEVQSRATEKNGLATSNWAEDQNLHLLFDNKDLCIFYPGRHGTWTCLNLSFWSNNINNCCWRLSSRFGYDPSLPSPVSTKNGRPTGPSSLNVPASWLTNFQCEWILLQLHLAVKYSVPKNWRSLYVPGWNKDCDELYGAYENMNFAYSLMIRSWTSKLKQRWKMGGRSFTHSNRKAWSTLDHLARRISPAKPCLVFANPIALVMVNSGKWKDNFQDAKSFI